jgi:hypothetical protein
MRSRASNSAARLLRQYLYFCTSKASKASGSRRLQIRSSAAQRVFCVSICTFAPLKQVNCTKPAGADVEGWKVWQEVVACEKKIKKKHIFMSAYLERRPARKLE